MRFGRLYINWMRPQQRKMIEQGIRDHLKSPGVQFVVARMARSEVKNYMAELCEEADTAFLSPAAFMQGIKHLMLQTTSTGDGLQDDGTYDPEADAPFSVVQETVTLPNGHTSTCTCPDSGNDTEINVVRGGN